MKCPPSVWEFLKDEKLVIIKLELTDIGAFFYSKYIKKCKENGFKSVSRMNFSKALIAIGIINEENQLTEGE